MNDRVVSLFSGGGGFDLGFIKQGYQILWANDNEKNAVDTYSLNIGKHITYGDINDVDTGTIPACDIVIGGPPCQSFSLAGNRNSDDLRGRLVWKYIEIIDRLRPKAFVFENVTGLLSAKNQSGEKILPLLSQAFENIGYCINQQIIDAAEYGVPQRRKRVIIVGLAGTKQFTFPQPSHGGRSPSKQAFISVKEALDDLPPIGMDEGDRLSYVSPAQNRYQEMMRLHSTGVTEHFTPKMSELDKYIIAHVKPGGNYMDIPPDVPSKRIRRLQRDGGHTTCYGRMDPEKPSYTVNTYFNRPNVGCNIHYRENRLISVREALRLQSFPDAYEIVSSSKQGRNLIVGNAVPPLVAEVIAGGLKEYIE